MTVQITHKGSAGLVGVLPCPGCGAAIRFSFLALLFQPSIACRECGLELRIDRENWSAPVEALNTYLRGMEDANRILDDNKLR